MVGEYTIAYTGAADAVCPITRAPLGEIVFPVGFRAYPSVPYECTALAVWLSRSNIVPHMNVPHEGTAAEAVAGFRGVPRGEQWKSEWERMPGAVSFFRRADHVHGVLG